MRVLFLTHRLPYAPNRGDRARAYHIVRTLARQFEVHVVSLAHDDFELQQAARLRELGAQHVRAFRTAPLAGYIRGALSLPGSRPLTHTLLDAPGLQPYLQQLQQSQPPDVVLAYCSGMARFAIEEPLAQYPLVLDMVDVDSAKWALLAKTSRWPLRWIYSREARHLARFEGCAATRAVTTLVISDREQQTLQRLAPGADIRMLRIGVDIEALRPPAESTESPKVVFCGVMNYPPNIEGVLWFVTEVWPLIRAARPDATFAIVGAAPTDAITRLATPGSGIQVTGTVPDVREYLWSAAVSVAPLRTARGTQNKVLEALGAGLPCVITQTVADGMPIEAMAGCRVADTPDAFTRETLALLGMTGAERRGAARRAALEELGWDEQLAVLPGILTAAAAGRQGRRSY